MDKVDKYQQIILDILQEYASIPSSYPTQLRDEVIADKEGNHFQLITLGWEEGNYVYEPVFHLDIIDGKVWIQQNNSEANLMRELTDRGVSPHDIVIGFQPPAIRSLANYAGE